MQWVQCLVARHRPDRRRVRQRDGDLFAPCKGCGVMLLRDAEGWRLASQAECASQ